MSTPYPQQPAGQPAVPAQPVQPAQPVGQAPQVVPQAGVPAQPAGQGYSTAPQGFVPGYAQAGNAGYGYAPMAPVNRRVSYKLAGILSGIGALLAVSPFLAWFVIELIPGNHGDGGDGLYWLAVGMIFYVLPFGLILIVAGIVSAVMNSSSRS